jgi:cytochrome b561
MAIKNTRAAYGWAAIALHWISAIGVAGLYLLGERMEEAAGRAEKLAAQNLHVSVAVLLFSFLLARLLWSAAQPTPRPLERSRMLRLAAKAVQGLFLLMIAVLLVTGPLAIWSAGRAIEVFDLLSIPSPFPARIDWLHGATEEIHGAATKLFWPLISLHVAGALKHLLLDRDDTLRRILWVRSAP